jgi:hypothetical protein
LEKKLGKLMKNAEKTDLKMIFFVEIFDFLTETVKKKKMAK